MLRQYGDSPMSASLLQRLCALLQLDGRTEDSELGCWPKGTLVHHVFGVSLRQGRAASWEDGLWCSLYAFRVE